MIVLLFVLLTLIGLAVTPLYGIPIDEYSEQIILLSNIKEYANRLLDESHPLREMLQQADYPAITQSIERDHGQAVYYPIAPLLLWPNAQNSIAVSDISHAYTFLWFMLGVYAVYGICRCTGLTRMVSVLGAMLLYISPRFFAEGHYNNKDVVLLSLFLLVLWSGIRFMKKPAAGRALLFSLFGALAANARIIGIFPWALIGTVFVFYLTVNRLWSRKYALLAGLTIASFAGIFCLITPATWDGIVKYLKYVLIESTSFSRWNGSVLYRGYLYTHKGNPLPASYIPYMILVTLPLYTLPLALAGGVRLVVDFAKRRMQAIKDLQWISLCAVALCTVVPLAFVMLKRPNIYNGWRHVYFTMSGIVVLGAHGISAIRCFLRKHGGNYGMHRVFAVGLCLFMAFTAFDIARNLPNEYSYYNLLGHETAQQDSELDYWCVSTKEACKRLETAQRDERLPLVLGVYDRISQISLQKYQKYVHTDALQVEAQEINNTPYLLYNPTYTRIYGKAFPAGYHELFRIESYGIPVCMVLEADLP